MSDDLTRLHLRDMISALDEGAAVEPMTNAEPLTMHRKPSPTTTGEPATAGADFWSARAAEPVTDPHAVGSRVGHADPLRAVPTPAGGVEVTLPTGEEVKEATEELQRLVATLSADAAYLLSAECDAEYDGIDQEIETLKSKIAESRDRLGDMRKVVKKFQGVQEPVVASDGYTYNKTDIEKYVEDCKEEHVKPQSSQTHEEIRDVFYANKSLTRLLDTLAPLVEEPEFQQHPQPVAATSKRPAPMPAGE